MGGRMSKCLVTGGAGFIGSNLVRRLLEEGEVVIAVDNLSTGNAANLEGISGAFTFAEGDIRDQEQMKALMYGVRYVFHQAALPSVPRSLADPWASNDS